MNLPPESSEDSLCLSKIHEGTLNLCVCVCVFVDVLDY